MSTPQERLRIAESILNFEARRDRQGRLQVYKLPSGDGGGAFEVAGINELTLVVRRRMARTAGEGGV